MNTTPLLSALAAGAKTVESLRITRYYADAPNYHGPRDVQPREAAMILARHAAPYLLDWRSPADGPPPLGEPVLLAAPDARGEVAVGEGSLEQLSTRRAWLWVGGAEALDVIGWAPMPRPPERAALLGHPPRKGDA